MKKLILFITILLFLPGCFFTTPQSRQAYVNTHPSLSYQKKNDILRGVIRPGMTQEEVKASWGAPTHYPHKSITYGVVEETWRYGPRRVCFTNGRVKFILE
jgi:hypothetical protein